jgi:hypothetical protein
MQRHLPTILLVVGILCCGLALWGFLTPDDTGGLVIDQPERTLTGLEPGKTHVISFTLRNTSRVPIRIVGLAPC